MASAPPGRPVPPSDGRMDAGRPGRPSSLLHLPGRAAVRPRRRGHDARRHAGLRDVGRARRQRVQRRPAVPRVDGRQPRRRAGRPRPSPARAGGRASSAQGWRSTPIAGTSCASTCSAAARAAPGRRRPIRPPAARTAARFPVITIRDMVRAQARLADHLGIDAWHSVIGGSMGGMQVLEWAITYPKRVRSIIPIATCMQATAQQIAWGAIGRRALRLDPKWRGGDYYDAPPGDGPSEGLAIARMVAQVTFRSDNVFTEKFGRGPGRRGDARRPARPVAALRGRALPRPPRHQADQPLRRQQLPDHRQGDGPARRRPGPRRRGAGDGADHDAVARRRHLQRHALPDLPAAPDPRPARRRSATAGGSSSTHRTGTTRS